MPFNRALKLDIKWLGVIILKVITAKSYYELASKTLTPPFKLVQHQQQKNKSTMLFWRKTDFIQRVEEGVKTPTFSSLPEKK